MIKSTKAYIAGFLDADGSVFLQLVRRTTYKLGYQIRGSIVFYQKQENKRILNWLKNKIRIGYIRDRNDGLSEYTIVGLENILPVFKLVEPFVILKRPQIKLASKIIKRIKGQKEISAGFLLRIAKEVDKFSYLNYSKKRTNTIKQVRDFLSEHRLISP